MSSPGLLCLKWNNHTSAFDKLLNNLHLRDVYSDGTIVCHGKYYPVHRFVLSTCSEYFEEIFRQSINLKSKHPFIIVKDIHPTQMEALLNYMYRGEVNVPQEMLPELIKAAEAFKIKGLAVPDDEPPPSKSSSSRDRKRSSASLSSPNSQIKKSRRVDSKINSKSIDEISHWEDLQIEHRTSSFKNYSCSSSQNDTEEFLTPEIPTSEIKSEPTDLPVYHETGEIPEQAAPPTEDYFSSNELGVKEDKPFESYATAKPISPFQDDDKLELDDQYDLAQSSWEDSQDFEGDNNLEENDSAQGMGDLGAWTSSACSISGHKDEVDSVTSVNIPVNINLETYRCSFCPYQCSHRSHIEIHLRKHTGEKPFQCPHCSFKCSLKGNLQTHIVRHTGEKRFHCSHCSYSAIQKITLLQHLKKHDAVL